MQNLSVPCIRGNDECDVISRLGRVCLLIPAILLIVLITSASAHAQNKERDLRFEKDTTPSSTATEEFAVRVMINTAGASKMDRDRDIESGPL